MVDVTDATFEAEVMVRSDTTPVVIDLWATWCGPCVQLGPIIERVVAETEGKVVLVKVDVDANPQISNAFKVQSIPAVFAMDKRRIVDQFLGAQPEAAVREFVSKLLPTVEQTEVERLIEAGDEESLRAALEIESDNPQAVGALVELLIAAGDAEEALRLLARLPETPEVRRLAALARTSGTAGSSEAVNGDLAELIDHVKGDDEARRRYVDLLEVLGPDDPRTAELRRKLMARLY